MAASTLSKQQYDMSKDNGRELRPNVFDQPRPTLTRDRKSSPIPAPIRSMMGFLCSIAILCFIVVLILNLIAFFPAIAITAPELIAEHSLEVEFEIPIIIDNNPPEISNLQNRSITCKPGDIVFLSFEIKDEELRESYVDLNYKNSDNSTISYKYPLVNDLVTKNYVTYLQVPTEPGVYYLNATAIDYAGNINRITMNLTVEKSNKPFLTLLAPDNNFIINSSTELKFTTESSDILKVSYTQNNQLENITLNQPYSISTNSWSEGWHTLFFNISTDDGRFNNLNFTFLIDNTPPEITTALDITPLTKDREEVFRNRLTDDNYYRGEFVKLDLGISENNFAYAEVNLTGQDYRLKPTSKPQDPKQIIRNYRTILSLPEKADEYELEIYVYDLAGNYKKFSQSVQLVKISFDNVPMPILSLDFLDIKEGYLPIINSSTRLQITNEAQYPITLQHSFKYNIISNETETKLEPEKSLILDNIPRDSINLVIQAKVTYHNLDYLFITLPYPQYLFILPIILTGWWLLAFFIFIATAIIISNLYLLKSSLSDALGIIKQALENLRAPMMESKNSLIMLGQVFLAVISFNIIYNVILALSQVPTRTPDFSSLSTWTLIYNLTSAAVYEEIITRILLIGIPLLVIHLILRKLKSPKRNYILGGGFELNRLTIFLIVFSSVTFGLAHAPGWDYWKVIPTFVSSLALGYLFIIKGIYASILLHFSVNFLTIPLHMLNYPLGLGLIFTLLIYFWVLIGMIYFGYYFIRIFKSFLNSFFGFRFKS